MNIPVVIDSPMGWVISTPSSIPMGIIGRSMAPAINEMHTVNANTPQMRQNSKKSIDMAESIVRKLMDTL